jgi:hypothetical protein
VIIALLSAGLKEDFTDAVKAAWLWLWDFLTRSMVQVAAWPMEANRSAGLSSACLQG